MNHVNGLDVSDYQGVVDWIEVKNDGYSFAIAKATESIDWTAQTFASNVAGIRSAGLIAGAYHMFNFTEDPNAQAEHFLKNYQPAKGDLPPAVDLELVTSNGQFDAIARISRFLEIIERALQQRRAIIYLSYYFWQDNLGRTDSFSDNPLWLADYTNDKNSSMIPPAWPTLSMWQYSQAGSIAGIDGAVDLNRFMGTTTDLQRFLI